MSSPVEIRILGTDDAAILRNVAPGVFDHDPTSPCLDEFLADSRHHLAVAMDEDLVVGMASGVHYVHPDKPNELWINEVGVAESHLRRGVGRRLLAALFDHAKTLGCTKAWVLTEEENLAARRLYSAVGGAEEIAVFVSFELGALGKT